MPTYAAQSGRKRPATASFTQEFGHELEAERTAWYRRRFLWYCAIIGGFNIAAAVLDLLVDKASYSTPGLVVYAFNAISHIAAYVLCFTYVWRYPRGRFSPTLLASALIAGLGAISLLSTPILTHDITPGFEQQIAQQRREAAQTGKISVQAAGGAVQFRASTDDLVDADDEPATPAEEPEAAAPAKSPNEASAAPAVAKAAKARPSTRVKPKDVERFLADAKKAAPVLSTFASLFTIFSTHFFACLLLPWTVREAMRPMWPLMGLNIGLSFVAAYESRSAGLGIEWVLLAIAGAIVLTALVPIPGLILCEWRHGRFRKRVTYDMLRGRYTELKHELTSARQIHEQLFPQPITQGPVRFEYTYEPMRQIGGDYLHSHTAPDGRQSVAIIDVTGHGIPAALTVNRLHGELDRIFAENPTTGPGELLTLLNRYVHLTLAHHSVYVTAICFRVNPAADTLEYASGGHPPAFVKDNRGRVEQLDSTTFVLGATAGPDFNAEPRSMHFGPGDCLVAYTDGATEARDEKGRYFGIVGIQRLLAYQDAPINGGWPAAIRAAVERYRYGPTADDILLVEIRRPVSA